MSEKDIFHIDNFDFYVPKNQIAQQPASPRDSSRLLHFAKSGEINDLSFRDIENLLKPGDLLIFNNTKVIAAELTGFCMVDEIKKLVTVNLVQEVSSDTWQVMARPMRILKDSTKIEFTKDLSANVLQRDQMILLQFNASCTSLRKKISQIGRMPLPQYIKRAKEMCDEDKVNYQTIYASQEGAIAAPTAGLHFTKNVMDAIYRKGVQCAFITLHVGFGTFKPIVTNNIMDHEMHFEHFVLNKDILRQIQDAKESGRRVIAVGTTSMRAIESFYSNCYEDLNDNMYRTNIFIKPGYKFKIIDALITNFHTPKSTLFVLVSAFCGLKNMRRVYAHAVQKQYRFFSYGDSSFLERVVD